jgi:hypothetical protein
MGEKWIDFVKRIHVEGQKKDKDYSFKTAMVDAGNRKSEWKKDSTSHSNSSSSVKTKRNKKGGKKSKSKSKGTKKRRGKKSRKN